MKQNELEPLLAEKIAPRPCPSSGSHALAAPSPANCPAHLVSGNRCGTTGHPTHSTACVTDQQPAAVQSTPPAEIYTLIEFTHLVSGHLCRALGVQSGDQHWRARQLGCSSSGGIPSVHAGVRCLESTRRCAGICLCSPTHRPRSGHCHSRCERRTAGRRAPGSLSLRASLVCSMCRGSPQQLGADQSVRTRQGDALPALAAVGGVQQDGGLAHDPALVAVEGDGVEAEVEALVLRRQAGRRRSSSGRQEGGPGGRRMVAVQRPPETSPCRRRR